MATWSRVKFYYRTMLGSAGSSLAADSTAPGDYSAEYLYDTLETTRWLSADSASPRHLTYDAGSGSSHGADYLAIAGHNLASTGATVALQYSTDGFATDVNDVFPAEAPATDGVFLKEFTDPGPHRHWRLRITGPSAPPSIAVCIWGLSTELDYAAASFDPNSEQTRATVNLSAGGYVTGVHTAYTERRMRLRFADADEALYDRIRAWREDHGLNNFFVAWERTNHPDEVYLMRSEPDFSNPLTSGGLYRDVTVNLIGRKDG